MAMIDRRHVVVGLEAANSEEALRKLAAKMVETGQVKPTYPDALVKREGLYPTGLKLKFNSIAMPHTDPQYVNKPGIALAKLATPVEFMHMGGTGETVQAEMLFMMAITDPDAQIENLKKVMSVFMDEEVVRRFTNVADEDELYQLGKEFFE